MNTVNWFLFELLVLGYVEDPTSGASFRLPGGLVWAVYIEVSRRDIGGSQYLNLLGSPVLCYIIIMVLNIMYVHIM